MVVAVVAVVRWRRWWTIGDKLVIDTKVLTYFYFIPNAQILVQIQQAPSLIPQPRVPSLVVKSSQNDNHDLRITKILICKVACKTQRAAETGTGFVRTMAALS